MRPVHENRRSACGGTGARRVHAPEDSYGSRLRDYRCVCSIGDRIAPVTMMIAFTRKTTSDPFETRLRQKRKKARIVSRNVGQVRSHQSPTGLTRPGVQSGLAPGFLQEHAADARRCSDEQWPIRSQHRGKLNAGIEPGRTVTYGSSGRFLRFRGQRRNELVGINEDPAPCPTRGEGEHRQTVQPTATFRHSDVSTLTV